MDDEFRHLLQDVAKRLRQHARHFDGRKYNFLQDVADGLMIATGPEYEEIMQIDKHSWQKDDHYHGKPAPGRARHPLFSLN